jgi:hypothetical protein
MLTGDDIIMPNLICAVRRDLERDFSVLRVRVEPVPFNDSLEQLHVTLRNDDHAVVKIRPDWESTKGVEYQLAQTLRARLQSLVASRS